MASTFTSSRNRFFSSSASSSETFSKFFEQWLSEQNQYLHQLISAADSYSKSPQSAKSTLRQLVEETIHHYEHYYHTKSNSTKRNVLPMVNPEWVSSLENAFIWIGGWRPSMAFHLLYSKSGLQMEARLDELLRGLRSGDLGDLSPIQLKQIDKLQMDIIREENKITEEMAAYQETAADTSMVQLSHVISEMIQDGKGGSGGGSDSVEEQVETTLKPKESGLEKILLKADDLRLKTLKKVIDILTPIQAVHFLIAAAELHLRIHEWGKKKDGHPVSSAAR